MSEREPWSPGRGRAYGEDVLLLKRLVRLAALVCLLLVAGTVGFSRTEHVSLWYAFVWTVDTLATVGALPSPHTTGGQVLKVVLIAVGVGTLFYALVATTEFFVAGHVTGLLHVRRRQRVIDALSNHYLICGFGRVGRQAARDLRAAGASFVVIDTNPESLEDADRARIPYVHGEASDEDVLHRAGIERACALLACVDSDADNVFITLTARGLRPDIAIVARAGRDDAEDKLRRAGADRVISPYKASGSDMARLALHPQVADVHDVTPEYRMEEIEVPESCPGAGRALADVRGATIVAALRRRGERLVPQPPGDIVLEPGDVLIAMGPSADMDRLEALFVPSGSSRS